MQLRDDIIRHLDDYLRIDEFSDYGPQGLQVEGKPRVAYIITAVSASAELFEKAAAKNADMIIVHHGLLWNKDSHIVKGSFKKRLLSLLQNDITLLGYHLPLDKHPEIGNNSMAAKKLGLENISDLGEVGVRGTIPEIPINEFFEKIKKIFNAKPILFPYGPDTIRLVAFCSGGCQRDLSIAIDNGMDVFVTGEASEATMHLAKECGIHFIAAGHYATERLGIQALGQYLAQNFNLKIEFIDIPNPV